MSARISKALAAWRELNDRQQGTLAAIYGIDQSTEEYRRRDAARGDWSSTPASEWRRINFSHEPSDRRLFGTTELQNQLAYRGWDNQGNGSTMAALAERRLITRSSKPTTFGVMHTVAITQAGRAAAKAGTSMSPGGTPKVALSERAWEVLALLWTCDLRGEVLKWYHSPTIDKALIGKHLPPLAEKTDIGWYAITDRGRWFYREQYAAHVGAYPDVTAPHPDGAAAEPWPVQADNILTAHHVRCQALSSAWQGAHNARQAAETEASREQPAIVKTLPTAVTMQIAERRRLWTETAQQRADLAAAHVDDLSQRCERAAREFAAAALAAFAAAVTGTDPLLGLRAPGDNEDTWDEPPLPRPPETGIHAIDSRAAKLHAIAVGRPLRRRGPAPTRSRSVRPERPPQPGEAAAELARFLHSHVEGGALQRRSAR